MQQGRVRARGGRKSEFSPDEITGILRMMDQGRYASVADLCAFHGISRQTYYNWQAKYGHKAVLALRVDQLEAEVRRLKEAVFADRGEQGLQKAG